MACWITSYESTDFGSTCTATLCQDAKQEWLIEHVLELTRGYTAFFLSKFGNKDLAAFLCRLNCKI